MDSDFLVIGAGIAGASAAYELARAGRRVTVLERESAPGYHSTGRSAAVYTENYGNRIIRALAMASKPFLLEPPDEFADHPLLTDRGALMIAREDQGEIFDQTRDFAQALVDSIREIDQAEATDLHPCLDAGYFERALYEPDAKDIDVHGLHQGFLRGLAAAGGRVVTDADVQAVERTADGWTIRSAAGVFSAPVVVNAAGAWADEIAVLAGVRAVGLVPKRRTAITFDPPDEADVAAWPVIIDVDEQFYFKPEAGRVLASPADETPVPPQDVQPEELDIAVTVDRVERASTMTVGRIDHRWAGLRSFVADKTPVVGMAPDAAGFFWLAGQGGYGIKTSPALGRITAALAQGQPIPGDVGVAAAELTPERLHQ